MTPRRTSAFVLTFFFVLPLAAALRAQTTPAPHPDGETLRYVVYLSRHGVRSPTGKAAQYNTYSTAPWPAWSVPPGNLTAHGFRLMQIFGAWDRTQLAEEGLLHAAGCADAPLVTIYADSDQRTRETGRALAMGLFPECSPPVHALPEGTPDQLFHPLESGAFTVDSAAVVAAISGRIGGDPNNLTAAYHTPLEEFDSLLAKCGCADSAAHKRSSILDIPARLTEGNREHPAELRGPLATASTLTENLLLEYTENMPAANVGWGCVDGRNLRSLIDLHTEAVDFAQRTPAIARMQASNLLDHILQSIEQASAEKPVKGALGKPADRLLMLIGHDTNISNVAGLLRLTWIADGRRDDTPPGDALVFELWHSSATNDDSVRIYYTTQTLEQMRGETPLSAENPPVRVPVFLPSCSRSDFSCSLSDFKRDLTQAIDPNFVILQ
ncbi:MAG TPA: histidine-type phosphatase [Terracidiphilus sp.]|nr:histidine-type phosphatase [Terracidiphilus sp.]